MVEGTSEALYTPSSHMVTHVIHVTSEMWRNLLCKCGLVYHVLQGIGSVYIVVPWRVSANDGMRAANSRSWCTYIQRDFFQELIEKGGAVSFKS